RTCVGFEIDDVYADMILRQRQPWPALREAGEVRGIPLHRRAAAVAAYTDARYVLLEGIAHVLGRDRELMHADLVAVIECRRAAQCQQQHGGDAGLLRSDAACDARA